MAGLLPRPRPAATPPTYASSTTPVPGPRETRAAQRARGRAAERARRIPFSRWPSQEFPRERGSFRSPGATPRLNPVGALKGPGAPPRKMPLSRDCGVRRDTAARYHPPLEIAPCARPFLV